MLQKKKKIDQGALKSTGFFFILKLLIFTNFFPNFLFLQKFSPRPLIGTYSHVAMTIRYKDTAWKSSDKRIWPILDDGQTDGHPKSIGPQPLGLGPN